MPNIAVVIFSALLFFVLAPGVVFTIPSSSSSRYSTPLIHALIFAIIAFFFYDSIQIASERMFFVGIS